MKVVIVGGGFSGRNAALQLERVSKRDSVILLDANPYSAMTNALPDVAADSIPEKRVREDLRLCVPGNVEVQTGAVDRIDLDSKTVYRDSDEFAYDKLILCCGSKAVAPPKPFSHLKTHVIDSLESARSIRDSYPRYVSSESKPRIVVIGGGYTGIELACFLVGRSRGRGGDSPPVTIVEMRDSLLPFMNDRERAYVYRHLKSLGVRVVLGTQADPLENGLSIAGESVENPFVCWSTGSRLSVEIQGERVEQIKDRRLVVDSRLRVKNYPDVFAAGDAAAIHSGETVLRKAVSFSAQTGSLAGKNCLAALRGDAPQRYHPIDYGWVIPLGTGSVGRLMGGVPVRGRSGLFLHYATTGIRNYNPGNSVALLAKAFRALF